MAEVFLSLRFAEAMEQAKMVKNGLSESGISCFLCSVSEGHSIADAVVNNLTKAKLVVIFGSHTYGQKTDNSYSTYNELKFIHTAKKPFFLLKMCDNFLEPLALFSFTDDIAYFCGLNLNLKCFRLA